MKVLWLRRQVRMRRIWPGRTRPWRPVRWARTWRWPRWRVATRCAWARCAAAAKVDSV